MPNAREFWIIHVSLQRVPPRESLHTASNHQPTLERIRSGRDTLLVGHSLLDALSIQMSSIHPNSTARPLSRLPPTLMSFDMAL